MSFKNHLKNWVRHLLRFGLRRRSIRRIRGAGNRIESGLCMMNRVVFDIQGSDNVITIGEGCVLNQVVFHLRGDHHRVTLGNRVAFRGEGSRLWLSGTGCSIEIGRGSTFEQADLTAAEDGVRLVIGEDCMFAHEVDVRTTDAHSILDEATGRRINPSGGITIGSHVWVGKRAVLLKGVTVGHDAVIAFGSVVTRDVPAGSIAAGMPAKVIRSGVSWTREQIRTAQGE